MLEGDAVTIDLPTLAPWLAVILSAASLYYSIANNRSKDTSEKFILLDTKIETKADRSHVGILAGKLDIVEDKVTIVQNDLKHLPDKDITHRLEMSIGEMRTEMRGLAERMKPIGAMAERMQEAILEKVMSE